MLQDIEDRLRADPGSRTLGELLQEREAALHEIRRLRARLERLTLSVAASAPQTNSATKKPPMEKPVTVVQTQPQPSPGRSMSSGTLLRLRDVCDQVGVGRSTIYHWLQLDMFPHPIRFGVRTVRWPIESIEQWRSRLGQ